MKSLDSNSWSGHQSHSWDNISVRMIQICDDSFALPLKLIFGAYLQEGTFPEIWKYANVVPAHKKESKNLLKMFLLISLLPIFGKTFGRVIYNFLFNYLIVSKLITPSRSGFLSGGSCIARLIL